MLFDKRIFAGLAAGSLLFSATAAWAHVGASGLAVAGKNAVVTLGVGHGCEGADSYSIEVHIPAAVTAVRAFPSAWGEAVFKKNAAGAVTSVTWSKNESRPEDDQYYQFQLRLAVPDAAFTQLFLPTTQRCRNADGDELVTEWDALPAEIAAAAEGEEPPPAPALWIVPARMNGWNKYTNSVKIEDLSVFDDAQIVWVGDAAYSSNPETQALIASEEDVDELTEIPADSEIWVRY